MRTESRAIAVAVAVAGVAALAAGAAAGPADVACNRWNECWRVHDRYANYPRDAKIVLHDEKWASHHTGPGWRWLPDHADRGYYRRGVWRRF